MNFLFSTRNPYQAAVDKLTLTLTSLPPLPPLPIISHNTLRVIRDYITFEISVRGGSCFRIRGRSVF